MQLVDQFYQFPGKCFFTGSSALEGPILDTGHHVDGEGRVYIGHAFLTEACGLLGWVHPEQVELIEAENESLKARVAELEIAAVDHDILKQAILGAAASIQTVPVFASPATPAPFSKGS